MVNFTYCSYILDLLSYVDSHYLTDFLNPSSPSVLIIIIIIIIIILKPYLFKVTCESTVCCMAFIMLFKFFFLLKLITK